MKPTTAGGAPSTPTTHPQGLTGWPTFSHLVFSCLPQAGKGGAGFRWLFF